MEENLANHRRSYEKSELHIDNLTANPMQLFKRWFDEVEVIDEKAENNAMTVSSIDAHGFPKSRVVLLKQFSDEGFVFYTNYTSEKGQSIIANPKVGISFFWPKVERQVIIRGTAEKVTSAISDAYFQTRPRGSQLGAWVSHQSQPIENREVLEARKDKLKERFEGQTIPRPDFWGGFIVKPQVIEFWQGRPNRLHDRFSYTKIKGDWKVVRLAP